MKRFSMPNTGIECIFGRKPAIIKEFEAASAASFQLFDQSDIPIKNKWNIPQVKYILVVVQREKAGSDLEPNGNAVAVTVPMFAARGVVREDQ